MSAFLVMFIQALLNCFTLYCSPLYDR